MSPCSLFEGSAQEYRCNEPILSEKMMRERRTIISKNNLDIIYISSTISERKKKIHHKDILNNLKVISLIINP
jgi:branched-subunit amino acid aminotransferase/4-amino-4-deoxychorismate lyase